MNPKDIKLDPKDLLSLDKPFITLLTPKAITILYWILMGLTLLGGIAVVLLSIINLAIGSLIGALIGLAINVAMLRITFEIVMYVRNSMIEKGMIFEAAPAKAEEATEEKKPAAKKAKAAKEEKEEKKD